MRMFILMTTLCVLNSQLIFAGGSPDITEYKVQKGQCVYTITQLVHRSGEFAGSRRFVDWVIKENKLDAQATIYPGQTIKIPSIDSWRDFIGAQLAFTKDNFEKVITENQNLKTRTQELIKEKEEITKKSKQLEVVPVKPQQTQSKNNSIVWVLVLAGVCLLVGILMLRSFYSRKNKNLEESIFEKDSEIESLTTQLSELKSKPISINEENGFVTLAHKLIETFKPILNSLQNIKEKKVSPSEELQNIIAYILSGQPEKNRKDITLKLITRLMEENHWYAIVGKTPTTDEEPFNQAVGYATQMVANMHNRKEIGDRTKLASIKVVSGYNNGVTKIGATKNPIDLSKLTDEICSLPEGVSSIDFNTLFGLDKKSTPVLV